MKKKLIIIFSVAIVIIFSIFFILFITKDNDLIFKKIKLLIPNSSKTLLKETIFKSYYDKKQLKVKNNELTAQKELLLEILKFKNQFVDNVLESNYYNYDEDLYLIFKNEKEIVTTKNKFNLKLYISPFINKPIHPRAIGSAFIEEFQNKIYLADSNGKFFYFSKSDLEVGLNQINKKIIPTNLKDIISYKYFYTKQEYSIKDLLIHNNKIYISFINEKDKGCFNTSILEAELNQNFLNFDYFFDPVDCIKEKNDLGFFNPHISAGRIEILDNSNLIFSTGGFQYFGISQNDKSPLGKILKININTKKYKILSLGHRNVQGLEFNSKNNYIISSEHGPIGGDEININLLNKSEPLNFGWPISSYGDHYTTDINKRYELAPLKKNHSKFGFMEPLIFFKPSIATSEILNVDKFLSDKDNLDDYFLGTLGHDKNLNHFYLHHLKLNYKNNKIHIFDKIFIGERIRDMKYIDDLNLILLFLENSGSLGVLKLSN